MSGRLRILIALTVADFGGAQIAALRLARGLHERGHDLRVLFFYKRDDVGEPDFPYEVLLPSASPGPAGYLRIARDVYRYIRRERPDLVLTFLPLAHVVGQSAARLAGVGRRVISHRTPVDTMNPLLRRLDTLWAWLGVYTGVVAVSEGVRRSCSHYPAWLLERTVVVHNGLRSWCPSQLDRRGARSRFGIPAEKFVLVAIGRLAEQKNYPLMLRIVQRLDNDVLLLIAGDGSLRRDIETEIVALGIRDKVRLLGLVARADVPDLLAAADVFIQTSTYEGQSNAVLEALQNRTPIVAHDIPEQRETIADSDGTAAGVLVPLDDLDAWVAAIEGLRRDAGMVQAARETASRRARGFTYETMITGFERALTTGADPARSNWF
jgi:glycosyltransferase involved in cell wall biosynthesis